MGNLYRDKQRTGCRYAPGGRLLEDPGWIYAYDDGGNLVHKISKTTRSKHISLIVDDDNPASMLEWHYEWNADGTLKTARNSDHVHNRYEYDALGRRTAKTDLTADTVTRFVWDGNVPLHEWTYPLAQRPALLEDEHGDFYYEKQEPRTNLTTWIFDEGTFAPSAKLVDGRQYSIITDHLGTPYEAYDEKGKRVWDRELDVYGKVILENGEKNFIPFRFQGQYEDEETGLYYNFHRYYDPNAGIYISQDPIGLAGGNPTLYGYVFDSNTQIDPFGLDCGKVNKARRRQHKMLQDNKGFNISPTDWDAYPSIGRNGTFITDRKGALGYFGNFKKGDTITISSAKATKIESDMGLNSGSLQNGFKVREVSGISSMNPRSPLEGNEHFLGGGQHLPGGAPKMVICQVSQGC